MDDRSFAFGKTYLKDGAARQKDPVPPNSQATSFESNDKDANSGTLDIPWETIRQAQETDVTLKKLFELSRDPEPPTNVNEFGMGLVNLWSQRRSLEIINGVIHRNTNRPKVLYCTSRFWFRNPCAKVPVLGTWRPIFWTLRSSENYRQIATLCLLVRLAQRRGTFLSEGVTHVVGTARDRRVHKGP